MASKPNHANSTGSAGRPAPKRNKKRNAAAAQERRQADEEMDESDSDDDAHMLEADEQVQVDFDVRAPQTEDTTGIVALLRQSFPSASFSLTDLAASIIQNRSVGNVLVAVSPSDDEDDEEAGDVNFDDVEQIMGITTIAKLSSDTKPMKDIRSYIEWLCGPNAGGRSGINAGESSTKATSSDADATKRFLEIMQKNTSGLLVNERLINIPASVVAPLFQQLKTDYEDAVRANKWSKYTHFVYFIKMYQTPPTKNKAGASESKNAAKKFEFVVEEDELISQAATCYVDYNISHQHAGAPTGGKWSSDKEMIPYRRVCLLEVNRFWALLPELERLKTELGNINIAPIADYGDEEYVEKK